MNVEKEKKTEGDALASVITKIENPDEFLVESYRKYIDYTTAGRNACNYLDGFLNVQRRILYAASKICPPGRFIKAHSLGSDVSKNYSPHGDQSSSNSIISMVSNGFLDIVGSPENDMGVEYVPSAAPRYYNVSLSEISSIIFLNKDLLPYVDYAETELSSPDNRIFEPTFLPVLVPGVNTAVGINSKVETYFEKGFQVAYPKYSVLSLLDYAIKFLETGEFDKSLLFYQVRNLVKRVYTDSDVEFSETFRFPYRVEDDDVRILAKPPLPVQNYMETMLKNVPYVDYTNSVTDIVFPLKFLEQVKMSVERKFKVRAYKIVDSEFFTVVVKPFTLQDAFATIISTFKDVLFPRYFESSIEKMKTTISEYEMLKTIRDEYIEKGVPFSKIPADMQVVAGKHRVSTLMQCEEKISKARKELEAMEKRSKKIPREILKLYRDARDRVSGILSRYWKEKDIVFYDVSD